MSTDILMINVHSCRNAGDAALTLVSIDQLRRQFPECRITLAMDDPGSHLGIGLALGSFFQWVKREGQWHWFSLLWLLPATLTPLLAYRLVKKPWFALTPVSWRPLIKAYVDTDLVVSKPGGFLYSSGRGLSLIIALYTLWLAHLAEKPVYLFPQSIGPFARTWERALVKYVLNRARIVMTREPISLHQLEMCGVEAEKCRLLPDPAFAFAGVSEEEAEVWFRDHDILLNIGVPHLGMTVIDWAAQSPSFNQQTEYEGACAAAIRHFVVQYGGRAILFPQVWGPLESQDDRIPARRVADRLLDLGEAVVCIQEPVAPDLLRTIYKHMDLFIGTRMHSNIFALSAGVPIIGIGYQPKTEGITQLLDVAAWSISIEAVTPRLLTELLDRLWRERHEVRSHLQQILPDVISEARKPGRMIASDFTEFQEGRK